MTKIATPPSSPSIVCHHGCLIDSDLLSPCTKIPLMTLPRPTHSTGSSPISRSLSHCSAHRVSATKVGVSAGQRRIHTTSALGVNLEACLPAAPRLPCVMVEYLSYRLHFSDSFAARHEHMMATGRLLVSRDLFLPFDCLGCTCDGRSYSNHFKPKSETHGTAWHLSCSNQFVRMTLC